MLDTVRTRTIPPFVPGGDELAGKALEVRCPADGTLVGTTIDTGRDGIRHAVSVAAETFDSGVWSGLEPTERAQVLSRFADALDRAVADFALLEAMQTGRPLREFQAQIGRLSEWLRYFGALATVHEGAVLPFPGTYRAFAVDVPLGPCGLITPWNHPLLILVKKLAPCLAAGNTVVAKPSEVAPLTALLLAELAVGAGLPEGVLNVIPGGRDAGAALAGDARLARIDLTGGTATGREVGSIAGNVLTQLTLELGGKAPVLVFDDVVLEDAAAGAAFAAFIASGQTCVAGARLLVHSSIASELGRLIAGRADRIRLGHPLDPNTQMGPLASEGQLDRVREAVARAEAQGAQRLTSRTSPGTTVGHFFEPVVLAGVTPDMAIARDEVFGPVLPVIAFEDEDDAIAIANGVPTALGAAVWTRDVARAHRVTNRLRAGVVWVNDHHRNAPSAPWGGFGESGFGRENGLAAYRSYLASRTVIIRTDSTPFDWYDETPQRYG